MVRCGGGSGSPWAGSATSWKLPRLAACRDGGLSESFAPAASSPAAGSCGAAERGGDGGGETASE